MSARFEIMRDGMAKQTVYLPYADMYHKPRPISSFQYELGKMGFVGAVVDMFYYGDFVITFTV